LEGIDAEFVKMRIKDQNMSFGFDYRIFERDEFEYRAVSTRHVSCENRVSGWKPGYVEIFGLCPVLDRRPEQLRVTRGCGQAARWHFILDNRWGA